MLGLFPNEARDQLAAANRAPDADPIHPGFFAGMGSAALQGVAEGAIKTVAPLMQGSQVDLGQAMSPNPDFTTPRDEPLEETKPEDLAFQQREATQRVVKAFSPDPYTTGWAGNMLHGLLSVGERAVAGSFVAGPIGAAGLAGTTEGFNTSQDLQQQGVDSTTANTAGAVTGAFTGAGVVAPGLGGIGSQLLTKVATGAIANVAFGAANRGSMSAVLDNAGYSAMAKQYKVLDSQAMISDAVMGVGFGAISHAFHPSPSAIDSAHTVADAVHVESDLAPGVPVTPQARDIHVQNITDATTALMNDEPVSVKEMPETIPNYEKNKQRSEAQGAMSDETHSVVSEALGENDLVKPDERRQDVIAQARMDSLYEAKQVRDLTPDETKEYSDLQEKELSSASVEGRRILGVQSVKAYKRLIDSGEQKPHQVFFDLDNFKDVNDSFNHDVGDAAIRSTGEAAAHYLGEGNVFHRKGDEFMAQGDSVEALTASIEKLRQNLGNHKLRAYDEAGNVIKERKGINFSHGIGRNIAEAEYASKLAKADKLRAGLRHERGLPNDRPVAQEPAAERGKGGSSEATGAETKQVRDGALAGLTDEIGWDQRGGKIVRGEDGEVNGRSTWEPLPRSDGNGPSDFWATYRGREEGNALTESQAKVALEKSKNSEKLGIKEKRFVDYANKVADDRVEQYNEELAAHQETSRQEAKQVEALDPKTQDAYSAAQAALERNPDLTIEHPETGEVMTAQEAMQRATEDLSTAKQEGVLHQIAAACFGRG